MGRIVPAKAEKQINDGYLNEMSDMSMSEIDSVHICTLGNGIYKIELSGKRSINNMIDGWLRLKGKINASCKNLLVVDNMKGEISPEGICLFIEILSEYHFYSENKIAIILNDENSYSTRFFDAFAKNWGLNIKHFADEEIAANWLKQKDIR
jgi:hypothetical protein